MGMTNGNRERIRRVCLVNLRARNQHSDHCPHLLLIRMADADQRLLDEVGSVFANRYAGKRRRQHDRTTRLSQQQCRGGILVDERLLHCGLVRNVLSENIADAGVDLTQAFSQRRAGDTRYRAVGNMVEVVAVRSDHTPPGSPESGV